LASAINRPPQNAAFQFSEGKVLEFRPAKDGQSLDQKKTVDLIAQNLKKIEGGEKEITLTLPIITTPPAVKTADVNNLGIKELVGKGISYFRGSISSRIHNIQLASSRMNGILIPPGETFSFNKTLGDVSQSTGYKEAYIIKEGRTILGDGGGVCQTSTTLFRAALNAGLPIIERHAHAYRVSYYEQTSDVGLDATVFDPTADLKIQNDTPAHLLLQTSVDLKNQKLIYELYGTADSRKVTISKSRIWDQTPPPPDLYQDDPTLPPGTVKQIDWKAWGAKVAFDYKVERNGEILQNRTFYSNYRPWQAIFLKGPATQ
jgi:vancomycin resistance protein YoaR